VASAIRFSRQYPACVCPLFRHSAIRVRQTSSLCVFSAFICSHLLINVRQGVSLLDMGRN
jgi:hypothetical protein